MLNKFMESELKNQIKSLVLNKAINATLNLEKEIIFKTNEDNVKFYIEVISDNITEDYMLLNIADKELIVTFN